MCAKEWSFVVCSSLALLTLACATWNDEADTSVNGSVAGQAFAGDAADFDVLGNGGLLIAISGAGGICQYASASDGGIPASLDIEWLSILTCGGLTDVTGDYVIRPDFQETSLDACDPKVAGATLRRVAGGVATQVVADGGMLTLTASSDQNLKGKLTLNFGGEAMTGEFTAAFCASLNH